MLRERETSGEDFSSEERERGRVCAERETATNLKFWEIAAERVYRKEEGNENLGEGMKFFAANQNI